MDKTEVWGVGVFYTYMVQCTEGVKSIARRRFAPATAAAILFLSNSNSPDPSQFSPDPSQERSVPYSSSNPTPYPLTREGARKLAGTSYHNPNRFDSLRTRSVSSDSRQRSLSVKRRHEADPPFEAPQLNTQETPMEPGNQTYTIIINADALDALKYDLTKIASLCDKIALDIDTSDISPNMKIITGGLLEAIRGLGTIQGKLLPNSQTQTYQTRPLYSDITSAYAPPPPSGPQKRARRELAPMVTLTKIPAANKPPVTDEEAAKLKKLEEEAAKLKKFKEAVKDAEKSTLLFNLDLGRSPIMNHDTMSTRASIALSKMAAKTENSPTSMPSEEARETLDDVLGLAKGITFFGKQTKTYRNPKDPENSGAFCTLPVKYEFKDRDTRARAEKVLRERCKVNCATPYPTILRECIRQAANAVKTKYPGCVVRINVDAANFALKLAKKRPGETDYANWQSPIPLPPEAYDIHAKKIPDGFTFEINLTPTPAKQPENAPAPPAQDDSNS